MKKITTNRSSILSNTQSQLGTVRRNNGQFVIGNHSKPATEVLEEMAQHTNGDFNKNTVANKQLTSRLKTLLGKLT